MCLEQWGCSGDGLSTLLNPFGFRVLLCSQQCNTLSSRDLNEYKIFMQKMSDLDLSCSFSSRVGLIFSRHFWPLLELVVVLV